MSFLTVFTTGVWFFFFFFWESPVHRHRSVGFMSQALRVFSSGFAFSSWFCEQ